MRAFRGGLFTGWISVKLSKRFAAWKPDQGIQMLMPMPGAKIGGPNTTGGGATTTGGT
jgi:hypothetical protein